MTLVMPFLSISASQPGGRRLAVGLALSLLAHLLLLTGLRPTTTAYEPPRAFQVEIRQDKTRLDTPFALTSESDSPATVTAAAPAQSQKTEAPLPNTSAAPAAGVDLRYLSDNYLTSREVDVRAAPVNDVDLVYPLQAYQNRVRGKVMLRLLINERGGLDNVSVLESEPRGTFEEAALTATWALRFSPAMKNGRSVKSRQDIEVTFDPYERINTP
jgi:protein TonB